MTNPLAQDLGGVVLLPCPFCGAQPELHLFTDEDGDHCAAVECGQCYGSGPKHVAIMDDPRPAAIAAWNRRTHSAEIAGALRDAERFDWMAHHGASLRNEPGEGWFVLAPYHTGIPSVDGRIRFPTARAAIDSAMQQGGGGG